MESKNCKSHPIYPRNNRMGEFWKSSQVGDGSNFLVPPTLLWGWVRLGWVQKTILIGLCHACQFVSYNTCIYAAALEGNRKSFHIISTWKWHYTVPQQFRRRAVHLSAWQFVNRKQKSCNSPKGLVLNYMRDSIYLKGGAS